jgi:hypothetical protein
MTLAGYLQASPRDRLPAIGANSLTAIADRGYFKDEEILSLPDAVVSSLQIKKFSG